MTTSKSATTTQAAPMQVGSANNVVSIYLRPVVVMALAYWASATFGAWLSPPQTYVSFWLPAGVYVTALLVRARREWPWLALGAFIGNLVFDMARGTPYVLFLGFHLANVVQAFSGAWLVQRFVGSTPRFDSMRSFFLLVALAALAAQGVGAIIGAGTLLGAGYATTFWIPFCVWWGSCALACITVSSVALSWGTRGQHTKPATSNSSGWEFGLICALVLGGTWVSFALDAGALAPHKFILLPLLLLWAGVRFGVRGASLTCLLLVCLCTYLTNRFHVELLGAEGEMGRYVFTLQAYLATSAVVALLPAIILAERDRLLSTLRDSEARYGTLVDANRTLRTTAVRDVTVRREAEAALRAGEEVLRLFIEHAPAAIAMLDTEMRYLRYSQRWLTDYHLEGRHLLGRSHYEIFPDLPERWREVHRRVITGAIECCSEDAFPRVSGKVEWIQWEARPWRKADGRIGGLIFFTQVVTQRKEAEARQSALEAQLRQAQKLDAVGTLAGGIAHDFNNILGAVSAHAELARLDALPDSEIEGNLDGVLRATRRASKLVQQILTFSRSQPRERSVMRLEPVVLEALGLLRSTLPSSIEFVHRIDADVPAVRANSTHMHQVLVNLCTNAAHAMRGRPGVLTVTLDLCPLGSQEALGLRVPAGLYVRLTVADNGHGMSDDVVQRIFDPFFTTKSQQEGTGLGLAVVHGIVLEHEGAIRVESRVGSGSTFHVLLPALRESAPVDETYERATPRGRGERILLIDDEQQLAFGTSKLLERFGYATAVFDRPTDALEEFARDPHCFGLVITDLTMPEIDGIELSRRILALRPHCPVLLTTGALNEATLQAAQTAGIRQVLLKPVDHRVLLEAIEIHLRSEQTATVVEPLPQRT